MDGSTKSIWVGFGLLIGKHFYTQINTDGFIIIFLIIEKFITGTTGEGGFFQIKFLNTNKRMWRNW